MPQLTIEQTFELAVQQHRAGQLPRAETLYREILARQPGHFGAMHLLGVVAHQVGQFDLAVNLISRAIALSPRYAEAYCNLGNALRDRGQVDEAISAFRQAIALKPGLHEAHSNLGNVLRDKGRLDEAIAACRQAIALMPSYPGAHCNLGNALLDKGELDEAIAACRRAIALHASFPEAHNNLGNALRKKGQLDEAVAAFLQAILLNPKLSQAHVNLGNALKDRGQFDDAIAAYRQAIVLNPKLSEAFGNLGSALMDKGELDAAIDAFRQAIALRPGFVEAHVNLGDALKTRGQIGEAIDAFRRAVALRPDDAQAHCNLILSMHYQPGIDARMIAEENRRWNRQHAEPLKGLIRPHGNDRDPERRIKIGYVSPDFRDHPAGRFLLPLLAHHDKSKFETIAYAHVPTPDSTTERLRSCVDGWRDIARLSDDQAADLIRSDGIDILVDLAMHSAGNRLLVFARKPAPVQVTYLAYCSSTGLETVDYRLSDPYLDPPGMDESVYSERTIRLPETYWCYQPSIDLAAATGTSAIERGLVTFGSLNNFSKVNESVLKVWAEILRAVPKSELLIHAHEGNHRQRVRDRLEREGIENRRVRFVGRLPMQTYLETYGQIDIALDTFPFGGGTTTCDALWMGAPVISLAGKTAVGRGGLSILSNVGLPDLVADSEEKYVSIARELAGDLSRLSDLRSNLRKRMERSPLMDAPRFARNVEAAYRQMWRTWCESTS
jgi:protein O-GlcNAc transferase